MKINYLLFLVAMAGSLLLEAQPYPASNFTLISVISPETGTNGDGDKYSGCWGWYQSAKNKEYAIAGSQSGTFWVDITNPATPTVSAYRAGQVSGATWREIKTYQNYCYVVSDDGGPNSLQIFDMQYLPDSVSKVYDSQSLFKRGHALWVDGNKLYVSSVTYSNNTYSSMDVYSLANPASPTLLRRLNQDYNFINSVHDMYVRNDTIYASCAYQGLYIFKLTNANTFTQLGSLTSYPSSGYNHSSALTPDGQTLVFMDEVPNGLPLKTANVSNLANIQVLATTNQFAQTTPHNPFMVSNRYCFVSSYQEGLQLYDISNPATPFLAGYFDTYPQGGGNTGSWGGDAYKGQWGAYPYFPSKTIFGLDMLNGIFLLKTALYQNPGSSFTAPASACAGTTFTPVNTSTASTSYTWILNGGSPATSTLSNPAVSYSAAGTYTMMLIAANATGSVSSTQTIGITGIPQAAASFTNPFCGNCNNGVISVTVSSGTAPYSYTWVPTGGNASTASSLSPGCYTVLIADANACTTSQKYCLSTGLGFAGAGQLSQLLIYPNPARDLLYIDLNGNSYSYSLYDPLGRLVISGRNLSDKTPVPVKELPAGIYQLSVSSGNETRHEKIIIGD